MQKVRPTPLVAASLLGLQVGAIVAILGLIYRLRLASQLSGGGQMVLPPGSTVVRLAGWWLSDLLFGLAAGLLVFLVSWAVREAASCLRQPEERASTTRRATLRAVSVAGAIALGASLLTIAAIYEAHLGTLVAMGTGLTFSLFNEAVAGGTEGVVAVAGLVGPGEVLFTLLPVIALVALRLLSRRLRPRLVAIALAAPLAVLLGATAIASAVAPARQVPAAVAGNPVSFVARQGWAALASADWPQLLPRRAEGTLLALRAVRDRMHQRVVSDAVFGSARRLPWRNRVPFAAQLDSVRFVHPLLVSNVKIEKKVPEAASRAGRPFNVLFVLMESTGLRYVTRPHRGKLVMPFLAGLAAKGLQLTDHFSPSNSSPRSIFTLFSGLYPMPEARIFSMSKGLYFPSVFSLLPAGYDTFMVTPAPLTWYFPRDFMTRSGPAEIVDYSKVPVRKRVPGKAMAKHEVEVVSYFLRRLDRAGDKPFFAVYYSFVAHWPYPDFGPRYRRFAPTRKIDRYLNNLYLLDTQIERMVKHLQARRLLERTILVFVGDHGEAFGQHKGNWTHSRKSFNENYQTPAIFYQPRLFAPRTIATPTSHVDVAPTLLDAMGIAYNPALMQGESLYQDRFRRRYLFLFGNENTLSSVSAGGIKLQLSIAKRKCWVYDLRRDPDERRQRPCKDAAKQYEATVLFQQMQRKLLRDSNAAYKADKPFHGQQHPPRQRQAPSTASM